MNLKKLSDDSCTPVKMKSKKHLFSVGSIHADVIFVNTTLLPVIRKKEKITLHTNKISKN